MTQKAGFLALENGEKSAFSVRFAPFCDSKVVQKEDAFFHQVALFL
jgi:hypothetical protein